ncbi:hypothetical protein [Streptomyces sp. MST-110588]|uniref:hypothetical protein n=1 Tax=Streptomyces sp. MST-110588 TaxID=2833628 RepID=UPI001F5DEC8A|nr:hypothetical protein [Streptomyces sp. MST-110588]UNO40212.1 hypothetical protein KGS77_12285 [Streptomyces sp. MST-110588]
MARKPVAWATAVVLVLETAGVLLLNWILAIVVDKQRMSMAGLEPGAMATGAWAVGALFGLYLLTCAFVLVRAAVRDRPPGSFGRIALICCAVLHGVLGAFAVGLLGWGAFALMMAVLGLLVLTLMAYGSPRGEAVAAGRDVPANG